MRVKSKVRAGGTSFGNGVIAQNRCETFVAPAGMRVKSKVRAGGTSFGNGVLTRNRCETFVAPRTQESIQ